MGLTDILLLGIRWLHALAAAAWVGGGLFYLLVLRPVLQLKDQRGMGRGEGNASPFIGAASAEFRNLVDLCIITLLVTGTVLAVSRLTTQSLGVPYFVTLAVKIALALWMFGAVRGQRRHRGAGDAPAQSPVSGVGRLLAPFRGTSVTVTVGAVVFLLADVLRFLVERSLGGS